MKKVIEVLDPKFDEAIKAIRESGAKNVLFGNTRWSARVPMGVDEVIRRIKESPYGAVVHEIDGVVYVNTVGWTDMIKYYGLPQSEVDYDKGTIRALPVRCEWYGHEVVTGYGPEERNDEND